MVMSTVPMRTDRDRLLSPGHCPGNLRARATGGCPVRRPAS